MENIYECIRRAQNGDMYAKEQIVIENSGLIWSVVKRFRGRADPEDLYQIGSIGLLKCIEKFDFEYQVKFSTYAVPMIMGEIKRFLRDDGMIKVSRNLKELSFKINSLQEQILKEENREISTKEISERLQADYEDVILAMEASKQVESIYFGQGDGKGNETLILADRLGNDSETEKTLEHISLKCALKDLDEIDRKIIVMRYFQDKTQTEVANSIGISQVQVSRTEKKILLKMRKELQ